MRRSALALTAVAALYACTDAPEVPSPEAGEPDDAMIEQLIASAPDGWQPTSSTEGTGVRIAEFVPIDPRDAAGGETVSFESLTGDPLPDPIDFLVTMGDDVGKACKGFQHFNTFSGLENNYPTSVRLFVCKLNPETDQGEVTLIKAIRGNDNFYVVTRTRQVDPIDEDSDGPPIPDAEMAAWSLYMRGIRVCDPRLEDHPCPAPDDEA